MYFIKTPQTLKNIFPRLIWDRKESNQKEIFLTFDDGPTPGVTDWVLDLLKEHNIKATFFCIGKNVIQNAQLYQRILDEGHQTGNHTFNHLNGWHSTNFSYYKDILRCDEVMQTRLYRPPYGRITKRQVKTLNKNNYNIVMWDVLSADFDTRINNQQCLNNVVHNARPGSIIVFHDSIKAEEKLKFSLPKAIQYFRSQGYGFGVL